MKIYRIFMLIVIAVFLFSSSSAQDTANQTGLPSCTTDNDCTYHEACHEQQCIDVCQLHNGTVVHKKCGDNAFCYLTSAHIAFCRCYTGYDGNPANGCTKDRNATRSCDANGDCAHIEVCHERKCLDVCQYYDGTKVDNKCGIDAYCVETADHKADCRCYSSYEGDPYSQCVKKLGFKQFCESDRDCPAHAVCHGQECTSVCKVHNGMEVNFKCGRNAYCYLSYAHVGSCKCLPQHVGDPHTMCEKIPDFGLDITCQSDADCPDYSACHGNECFDICHVHNGKVVDHKCGVNAICRHTKPHSASCRCPHNYSGDPYTRCYEIINPISFFPEQKKEQKSPFWM